MGFYGAVLMVKFLAEIAFRLSMIVHATPSNGVPKDRGVYEFDIGPPPESSYWTDWGGWYDEYQGTQIELYFGRFLQRANTMEELLDTPYSLFVDLPMVYFNITKHPWLYPYYSAEGENAIPFLSSALDPDNPSRNTVRGVPAEVRLEIPNFTVKLSDAVSGITLNQGFSLELANNDGYFDDDSIWDLFNTPVHLKKAIKENPSYEDFREIRGGYAGSTKTGFDKFSIDVNDKLRSMEEPVCGIIQQADFPGLTLIDDAVGKEIPVIYGTKKIDLVKLDEANHYIGAEYMSSVQAVFDEDGNPIQYSSSGNVITAADAETAIITGYTPNNIGEVVKDIVTRKTVLQYNNSNWNLAEVDAYIGMAPVINIAFTSGDVKSAVQDALKSDMAYFIQQADGKFTIRRYGGDYTEHELPAWAVTKKPEKDFDRAQENYFSSCLVKYNFTGADRDTFNEYYYTDMENDAEDRYRKRLVREYETDLVSEDDAKALAQLLGTRYTVMRQRLKLSVGIDTAEMGLLDTVFFDAVINGRKFSGADRFIITEMNPAQDILTLEEI
jgi:hypothetical protein